MSQRRNDQGAADPGVQEPNDGQNTKNQDRQADREAPDGEYLTTNQGMTIVDSQNSLRAGTRGPTLLEDFILREKIIHFDYEHIPRGGRLV